jgi:hypothetical protein
MLIRRSLSRPGKRAYYRAWGPAETALAQWYTWRCGAGPSMRAWRQPKAKPAWVSIRCRTWTGWYRHITLALLAHAVLVILQTQGGSPKGGPANDEVELSVAELRRLLPALPEPKEQRERRLMARVFGHNSLNAAVSP